MDKFSVTFYLRTIINKVINYKCMKCQYNDFFRAHYSFMDDCLDAYIVAACMHLLNLNDIGTEAKRKQPLYDISTDEERYRFIYSIAQDILEKYIKISDGN